MNKLIKRIYIIIKYKKLYISAFILDFIMLVLTWLPCIFLVWLYVGAPRYYFYTVIWELILLFPIFYLACYYEIFLWKLPFIYMIDFYLFYGIYRLIDYVERLDGLWTHKK